MRRLILFACYDPQCIVGGTLLYYLQALKNTGADILLASDCDFPTEEIDKIGSLATVVWNGRHSEYDFGSYKRAFEAADPSAYDVLYLINDSMAGPLYPILPYMIRMEKGGEAFGLAYNPSRRGAHLQSYFIGLKPTVFGSGWFLKFMAGIRAQADKESVCTLYETGLTTLILSHGITVHGLYDLPGRSVYNDVLALYRKGFPLIKRTVATRHGGSLGGQLKTLLDSVDPAFTEAFVQDGDRLHGEGYMASLLTRNPLVLAGRYFRYLAGKL